MELSVSFRGFFVVVVVVVVLLLLLFVTLLEFSAGKTMLSVRVFKFLSDLDTLAQVFCLELPLNWGAECGKSRHPQFFSGVGGYSIPSLDINVTNKEFIDYYSHGISL